ncbi:MAG: TonB-dependent receptor [candidate division KSB1 bacterium]|nr:TonB-dependent receptor [candidate division KSB1 bacterium]MDZ7272472.1 TonB-dependent receptor [candidate division KSB1 bacterium]MDZ7284504.1 TonB-dependent receptor [candidate division KSB1 bacterium]MDZ7297100.1 TonB-dependent receptor [candidate division KSB1 bacterium]MDZ7306140.1 TonB-dependent receptor [candidate division KSB1 bacterium]
MRVKQRLRCGQAAGKCLLLILLSAPLPGLAMQGTAAISGIVIDRETNQPLENVAVYLKHSQRGEVTCAAGRFRIEHLPPGEHELILSRQGFQTARQSVKLVAGAEVVVQIALVPRLLTLDEVQVTANRSPAVSAEVATMMSVVTAQDIRRQPIQQTPEVLREQAGVFIQKTNQGGGSASIRGLKANKLLLLVDGIRLNNATYRGGNHQYLNTVEAQALERIEVVHGPVSTLYGSDALGGAVNLITRSPLLPRTGGLSLHGVFAGAVTTADQTQTSHLGLSAAQAGWGVVLDASFKSFGEVTRGRRGGERLMQHLQNDTRVKRRLAVTQAPNGYDTFDLSGKVLVALGAAQELMLAQQSNRQREVPRYDVYEAQTDSLWQYAPQERDLSYLRWRGLYRTFLFDATTLTLSRHRQFERRVRLGFGSTTENHDQYQVVTYGLQVQFNKIAAGRHHVLYGGEFYHDAVRAHSQQISLATGGRTVRSPLYPEGSSFRSLGLFLQAELAWTPRSTVIAGLRWSAYRLQTPARDEAGLAAVTQTPEALTGSLSLKHALSGRVNLVANLAQGFRAPNLDDLSRLGRGKGDLIYEVPNPALQPEQSLSLDGGIKLHAERVQANLIVYYNWLTNLLVRQPTLFAGRPFLVEGTDTLAVYHKANAGRAYTTGFEVEAEVGLARHLAAFGNLSYTYGQNLSQREPLPAIPPMLGLLGLRIEQRRLQAEVFLRFAGAQNRLAGEDKEDLRIPEGGTPGWWTLNARASLTPADLLEFKFGLSNILDWNYREHVSGFNAPGRNFMAGAVVKF